MDNYPSRERSLAAALDARVTAIIVAGDVRASAAAQIDLSLRSAFAEPWIDEVIMVNHGAPHAIASAMRALQADRRNVSLVNADRALTGAAAANLGARQASGRWLLFLNPHVVLRRGAVARLAAASGNGRGPCIVGGRLTDTAGREQRAVRAGALNAWSALGVALQTSKLGWRRRLGEPVRVSAVSDSFMLIARQDFLTLGGFDADFLTDAADLDLCRRAGEAGGAVMFEPAASGVQFAHRRARRSQAQGLALFALKSAKTPAQRAFAGIARPALSVVLGVKHLVAGRPPPRR